MAASADAPPAMVKLLSKDEQEVEMLEKHAKMCGTLRELLDGAYAYVRGCVGH